MLSLECINFAILTLFTLPCLSIWDRRITTGCWGLS